MVKTAKTAKKNQFDPSSFGAKAVNEKPANELPQEAPAAAEPPVTTSPEAKTFCRDLGERRLDIEEINESGLNPRQEFDPVELQKLAESITKHGQLQNATARKVAGGYDLISGARRLRSIKLANLTHINCRVIECDDKTAIELRGMENYLRRDFNAIEEAQWFRQMIELAEYNQTSLAKLLKIDPSQVSNRLRLLKLPAEWQQKIVTGELPSTHARALIPWAEFPEILDAVSAEFTGRQIGDVTVKFFETSLVTILQTHSRSMTPGERNGPKFDVAALSGDDLTELKIVDVPEYAGAAKTSRRAFDIEGWEYLQSEATAKKASEEAVEEGEEESEETEAEEDNDSSAPTKTEEAPDVSRLTDQMLSAHFADSFGREIAQHLKPDALSLRLFLCHLADDLDGGEFFQGLAKEQDRAIDDIAGDVEAFRLTSAITVKNLPGMAHNLISTFMRTKASSHFSLILLLHVANDLGLKPFATWRPDQDLLELCSTSQLRELFTDEMASAKKLAKWTRVRIIKELLDYWPAGYLPVLLVPNELQQPPAEKEGE